MLKNSTFIITGAGGRIGSSLTEAIILKQIPILEKDRIITIWSFGLYS